ncbi:MAG: hypothetical protein ABJB49_05805 [Nitrospirota bacterium]
MVSAKPGDIVNFRESETILLSDLVTAVEHLPWRDATIHRLPEQATDRPLICAEIARARQATILVRVGLPLFIEWFQQTQNRT